MNINDQQPDADKTLFHVPKSKSVHFACLSVQAT